jgi:hypothetical protein
VAKSEKNRVGKLSRGDDGKPQIVESDAAAVAFDAAAFADGLGLYRLNRTESFFQVMTDPSRVVFRTRGDLARLFRIQARSQKVFPAEMAAREDEVVEYISTERLVSFAGPLCGKRVGVYESKGRRLLVTSSYQLLEPSEGEWPMLAALIDGLFITPEVDQRPWLFAWLKTAYESLQKGKVRPGHCLILAGPTGGGKSFFQNHVITALLGGREPADPTKYITGKTTFNSELFSSEHLSIQELPTGRKFEDRMTLAEELKKLVATENHTLHTKYCDGITVAPWWRVSISINDTVDKLRGLPPLSSDISDKILLLRCLSRPENLAGPSVEDWEKFLRAITDELPAFAAFLLAWEIPQDLRRSKHSARFGHDHYHNRELLSAMFEGEPESVLMYLLDTCHELYDIELQDAKGIMQGTAWGWKGSETFKEELCGLSTAAKQLFDSRKGGFTGAAGTFLRRLAERFPDRIKDGRDRHGRNVWLIYAPPDS